MLRNGKSSQRCSIRRTNWRWSVWRISREEVGHSPVNTALGISNGMQDKKCLGKFDNVNWS